MKSLILGSSGQVGSALFEYLADKGCDPIPFDVVRSPDEDLRIINQKMREAIRQADFVHFLAFDVGGSTYLAKYQNTFDFIHNNMKLMANTFDLLKEYNKPFIFASSQMSNMSFSTYGLLKAMGERYAQVLGGLIVKFWNVYGIEHDPEKTHVITDFIEMARTHKRITMRTNGEEYRQLLYSVDCAEALDTLAQRYADIPRDRELHITNFKWDTILDVADIIAKLYPGTEVIPNRDKTDTVQAGVRNEPDPFILNYWRPKTELNEGIAKVAARM
jgi:nucleoside-diphosphate-sugar epimerase